MSRRERTGPTAAADAIIELPGGGIVLIERKYPPLGWAMPGGFIEEGESAENAARREAKEETDLDVELLDQLYTYSDPCRDPRGQTLTVVFIARATGTPVPASDLITLNSRSTACADCSSLPGGLRRST